MYPSGSLAEEEKLTNSGLVPEVGDADMLTCGGWFGAGGGGGGGSDPPPRVLERMTPSFFEAPGGDHMY